MDQTHIGYTYWQQPPVNRMPMVQYVPADSARGQATLIIERPASSEETIPKNSTGNIFYEKNGYVSIEADHYTKAIDGKNIKWQVLPDHGRTGSAITTMPVTAVTQTPGGNAPHLEYEVYTYDTGKIILKTYLSPTLNFHNDEGLKYAVSIDDEQPQIITINKDDNNTRVWEGWMANNIINKTSTHHISTKGKHTIRYWMVSPAVVIQKIAGDMGGMKESYLGPPQTKYSSIPKK